MGSVHSIVTATMLLPALPLCSALCSAQGALGNWNPPFVHDTAGFNPTPPVRVPGQRSLTPCTRR
jgi:hypothetical protein